MKNRPIQTRKTNAQLAKKWNCHPKTITAWRRAGAPLSEPAAMRWWLSNRKNVPPHLPMPAGMDSAKALLLTPIVGDVTQTGAPAALRRLQVAELEAHSRYSAARGHPKADPLLLRRLREDWRSLLDPLRHFEKAVALDQRETGVLIPRAEAEEAVAVLGVCLRMSFKAALPQLAHEILAASDQIHCRQLLERCHHYCLFVTMAAGYAGRLPNWIQDAFSRDLHHALTKGETFQENMKKLGDIMSEAGLAAAMSAIRDTPPAPPKQQGTKEPQPKQEGSKE